MKNGGCSLPTDDRAVLLFLVTDDWFFLLHRKALATAALEKGFKVLVATAPGARRAEIEEAGFEFHPLRLRRKSRNPFCELIAIWDIYRLYLRLRPALVHHVSIKPILYGTLAARLARIPAIVNAVTGLGFVFGDGGSKRRLLRWMIELVYKRLARRSRLIFLFENPDDRDYFLRRRLLPPEKAVLILGSGVDEQRFTPRPVPDVARKRIQVLLAARLLWDKGVREYVKAARFLLKKGWQVDFLIAGYPDTSNPAAVPLPCLTAWHRQGTIKWLGYCNDMPSLYRQVDIVCLPTKYREGVPVVLLEAAACGKPLVATAVPGCKEIVVPEKNGLLVSPGSIAELSGALERLFENDELRRRYGEFGRKLVAERFSVRMVISATFAVYQRLLRDICPSLL